MTVVGSVLLGAWAAWRALRDRPAILRQLIGAAFVEFTLVLTAISAGVAQSRGSLSGDPLVLWGYLLTALFILPVAGVWAFADRTRTTSLALLVACATVAVMMWRSLQVAGL